MKASLRRSVATLVGSVALLVAPAAFALGEPCFNDTDCPNPACGGEVCNWNMPHAMPAGDKAYTCVAAGTDPKTQDGWCTVEPMPADPNQHCKCKAMGARCVGVHCTFTKAEDAPPGGGGGTGGTGSGTAGTGTAGTSTAGTGTAGTGTTAPADEGGCSISVPGRTGTGVALGLGAVGLALALLRRRR